LLERVWQIFFFYLSSHLLRCSTLFKQIEIEQRGQTQKRLKQVIAC